MTPKSVRRQGTRALCETLKFVNEANTDIAMAPPGGASEKDRAESAKAAKQSRSDARKWGCSWAS